MPKNVNDTDLFSMCSQVPFSAFYTPIYYLTSIKLDT